MTVTPHTNTTQTNTTQTNTPQAVTTQDLTIETDGISKRFGDTTALDSVAVAARPGTVLGVLGPNGAGKTTLIRILATLERPDSGRASVAGLDVVQRADQVRRHIGLTGQYATVDEDLTGRENLTLFGVLLDLPRPAARARAAQLLDQVGLSEAADRRTRTYSGGMRRRLDLAAGMVGDPAVLFLDEPTTGLDPGKREDLWRTIRGLADAGRTVLLTTQYLEEADALADEITVLHHGRVIAHDTPAGLKQRVGGQTVVVRPRDPAELPAVVDLLGRVCGHPPRTIGRGSASVAVDDERAFAEVVQALGSAGIGVTELALRLPSLDEAFRALTDHHTPADIHTSTDRRGAPA